MITSVQMEGKGRRDGKDRQVITCCAIMLTKAPMKVSHGAVQPPDHDVQHVRVETHRVPEPTTTTSRLDEHRSTPLQHGAQQPAGPQRRRRAFVGGRRRPDGKSGQRPVGSGRGPLKVGPQLNLGVDGPRCSVEDSQFYTHRQKTIETRHRRSIIKKQSMTKTSPAGYVPSPGVTVSHVKSRAQSRSCHISCR